MFIIDNIFDSPISRDEEIESLKKQLRDASIKYDKYLNEYCSRYEESIKNYRSVVNDRDYYRSQLKALDDIYADLFDRIRQIRHIVDLFESRYESRLKIIDKKYGVSVPQKSNIPTHIIAAFLDKLIKENPVTNFKVRQKEMQTIIEDNKDFFELVSERFRSKEYSSCLFDFLKTNIQDKKPTQIMITLLLCKEYDLFMTLPTALLVRDTFSIPDKRYRKIIGYEKFNVHDTNKFKETTVAEIETKIKNFKNIVVR